MGITVAYNDEVDSGVVRRRVELTPVATDTAHTVFLVGGTAWSVEKSDAFTQMNGTSDDVYISSDAKTELDALLNQAVGEQRCAMFGHWCWNRASAEDARGKMLQLVDTLSHCKFDLELNFSGEQENQLHHVILRNAVRTAQMLIERHRDRSEAGTSASEVQDAIDEIGGGQAMMTPIGELVCANESQLMCDVGPKNADGIEWVKKCFFEF